LSTQFVWSKEDLTLLHAYRTAYHLETPTSFKNARSSTVLTQGIGKYSPTMSRPKTTRRVPKEQLALAVRKHFNALPINEVEVIVDFLYKAKMKGTDNHFWKNHQRQV
jgi:histone deacetylase complex subunit SAP30